MMPDKSNQMTQNIISILLRNSLILRYYISLTTLLLYLILL